MILNLLQQSCQEGLARPLARQRREAWRAYEYSNVDADQLQVIADAIFFTVPPAFS